MLWVCHMYFLLHNSFPAFHFLYLKREPNISDKLKMLSIIQMSAKFGIEN